MLTTTTENYLLSPIIDHKEKYSLGDIEIQIVKNYENNLRSRNCQLGIVEALTEENPLNLCLGDIVFVHHFTFHGDIGANRAFKFNNHIDYEGKKIFRVPAHNIFFKYNDNNIEVVGDTMILEEVMSPQMSPSGLYLESTQYKDRGRVIYSSDDTLVGMTVFVDTNALYPLELKDKKYFKVFGKEVVGMIYDDELFPTKGRVLLEDEPDKVLRGDLDLSLAKKETIIKSKVIRSGILSKEECVIKIGDTVLRARDYGIKYKNQVVVKVEDENIIGVLW